METTVHKSIFILIGLIFCIQGMMVGGLLLVQAENITLQKENIQVLDNQNKIINLMGQNLQYEIDFQNKVYSYMSAHK